MSTNLSEYPGQGRLPREKGFSLLEVMVALGILALILLALAAIAASSLGFSGKSDHMTVGNAVAEAQLERAVIRAQSDNPAGSKETFWSSEYPAGGTPFTKGTDRVGNTDYEFAVFITTLRNKTRGNQPLGGDAILENRLKKFDAVVHWWTEQPGSKIGHGRTTVTVSRLVNERPL